MHRPCRPDKRRAGEERKQYAKQNSKSFHSEIAVLSDKYFLMLSSVIDRRLSCRIDLYTQNVLSTSTGRRRWVHSLSKIFVATIQHVCDCPHSSVIWTSPHDLRKLLDEGCWSRHFSELNNNLNHFY